MKPEMVSYSPQHKNIKNVNKKWLKTQQREWISWKKNTLYNFLIKLILKCLWWEKLSAIFNEHQKQQRIQDDDKK